MVQAYIPSGLQSCLASEGCFRDGVDKDAHTVGPQVQGDRCPCWEDDDVGFRLVLQNDLPGLLDGLPHHLRPRLRLLNEEASGGGGLRRPRLP
uniref:Uncharacterized protein n=1 Tax=Aegilops tauschii subsp. strangulata TaxID=200361 RepID=A0A452XLT1_AEGTS